MSASRRRRAATLKGEATTQARATAPFEGKVRSDLTVAVKRRLGLAETDRVPHEIQELVNSAAREVVEGSVTTAVVQEVTKLRPPSLNARDRSEAASMAPDRVLLHEAEILAAKKQALRVAGFSNDEAMRLLVAEVTGRASQAPR
jgi:hypothetical protein